MLVMSELDIVISKEAFMIGVSLTDSENKAISNALTGKSPSQTEIRDAIRETVNQRHAVG